MYVYDKDSGQIIDQEDGQLVATLSENATIEQGEALVKAYNAINSVNQLAKAMATAIADLSSEARGGLSVSHDLLAALDIVDPERDFLRKEDPENPLCEV